MFMLQLAFIVISVDIMICALSNYYHLLARFFLYLCINIQRIVSLLSEIISDECLQVCFPLCSITLIS